MSIAGVKNSSRIEARRRAAKAARNGARDRDAWNAAYPSGTLVTLTLDDGSQVATRTRSKAWCVADGTPIVLVDGKAGGWLLSRVAPRPEAS